MKSGVIATLNLLGYPARLIYELGSGAVYEKDIVYVIADRGPVCWL